MQWKTAITKVEPNHIVTRGYRQEDLIGGVPFSSVVWLLLKGELPDEKEAKLFDAILTSSVDHGVTPPTALASRMVASAGVPLPTAVAAGILAVGDVHGGAIQNCAQMLQEWGEELKRGEPVQETAKKLVDSYRQTKRRMPGLGHRLHTQDPRTRKLFALSDELGLTGHHSRLLQQVQAELSAMGKPLPINVDGAIAALVSDLGFDHRLGKAFFLLGRTAGLVTHVYEEVTREKPMRRICDLNADYDGPGEKDLKQEER
jgi:citrate synthase